MTRYGKDVTCLFINYFQQGLNTKERVNVMSVFSVAKHDVWEKFNEEVSGKFIEDRLTGNISIEVVHGPWHIILDTDEAERHEEGYYSTRFRVPIVNPNAFRFKVHKEGFLSRVGHLVGARDIKTGDTDFDEAFVVKSDQSEKAVELFSNQVIKEGMLKNKNIHFEIKDSEGSFGPKFSDDEDELCLEASGIITDIKMLEDLFHLIANTLDTMVEKELILPKEPKTQL